MLKKHLKYGIPSQQIASVNNEEILADISQLRKCYDCIMLKHSLAISPFKSYITAILNEITPTLKEYFNCDVAQMRVERCVAIFYGQGKDYDLKVHTDDSLVTINYCVKNTSSTSNVLFKGSRKLPNQSVKHELTGKDIMVVPQAGVATMFSGEHPHETTPIKEGERINIVIWLK